MDSDDFQVRRGRSQKRAIIGVERDYDDRHPSRDRAVTASPPEATIPPTANKDPSKPITIPIESALRSSTTMEASTAASTPPPSNGNLNLPDSTSGLQPPPDRVKSSGPSPLTLLGIGIALAIVMAVAIVIYLLRRCRKRRTRHIQESFARSDRQSIWGGSTSASPRSSFEYKVYTPPMAEKVPTVADSLSQAESAVPRPVRLFNRRDSYPFDLPPPMERTTSGGGVMVSKPPFIRSPYDLPTPMERTTSGGGVMVSKPPFIRSPYDLPAPMERTPSTGGVMVRPPPNKIAAAKSSPTWGETQFPRAMTYQKPNMQLPVMPLNADGFHFPSFPPAPSPVRYVETTPSFRGTNQYGYGAQNIAIRNAPDVMLSPKDYLNNLNFDYDATDYASTVGDAWANPGHNSVGFAANLSAPTANYSAYSYKPSQYGRNIKNPSPGMIAAPDDVMIAGTLPRWTDPLTWARDQSRRNATRSGEGGQGGPFDPI